MTTHPLNSFRVLQIDHVELFVPDRHAAAGWYQRILGLDVVPAYQVGDLQLKDSGGSPVTLDSVVDHEKAYSIYFCDPYGHHLELTAYECEPIRAALPEIRKQAR